MKEGEKAVGLAQLTSESTAGVISRQVTELHHLPVLQSLHAVWHEAMMGFCCKQQRTTGVQQGLAGAGTKTRARENAAEFMALSVPADSSVCGLHGVFSPGPPTVGDIADEGQGQLHLCRRSHLRIRSFSQDPESFSSFGSKPAFAAMAETTTMTTAEVRSWW